MKAWSKYLFVLVLIFSFKNTQAITTFDSSLYNTVVKDITLLNFNQDYLSGKADAKRHYFGYKNAATLTILSGTCLMLVSPVAGLTSAIVCSSTPPKLKNLNLPDTLMLQNQDYMAGYQRQAKKIKQRKVWTNWAIGFGINVSVIGFILMIPGK